MKPMKPPEQKPWPTPTGELKKEIHVNKTISIPLARPNIRPCWVIVGPLGNVWSERGFQTPEAASEYLMTHWTRATLKEVLDQGYRIVRGEIEARVFTDVPAEWQVTVWEPDF